MKVHIGLIAPYSEMIDKAEKLAEKKNVRMTACCAVLEDIVPHARRMEIGGADVIIVRQGSDAFLRRKVNIPVVPVGSSCFDVLSALVQARRETDRIALANFMGQFTFAEVLKEALNCPIQEFVFKRYEEAYEKIKQLSGKVDVLVGGGLTTLIAENQGIKAIMIKSSDEEIEFAIDLATSLVETRRDEERKRKQGSIIVNQSAEGIVALDEDHTITVYNRAAESIFGIPYREVIDTRNEPLLKAAGLLDDRADDATVNEILEIGGKKYFVHVIPLIMSNEVFGKVATFEEVARVQEMERNYRLSMHKKGHVAKFTFDHIIGQSRAIMETIAKAEKYAKSDFTVLITGETGTGKELFAQSIFNASRRNRKPFVTVNCATLPPNLLEAELFGYEEGAFTGAKKGGKQGYFELAHKGTIFLDEIGTMPAELQTRLLRVIQEKEIVRVGGSTVIPVDIRVIAATNTSLMDAVSERRFREDLYYRLNVLNLSIPPLRERREDIPLIAENKMNNFQLSSQNAAVIIHALRHVSDYSWKGNVRELINLIAYLAVLVQDVGDVTDALVHSMINDILRPLEREGDTTGGRRRYDHLLSLESSKREMERDLFKELLGRNDLTKSQIAEKLGVSRTTFWRKCRDYGLL